ncbi:MAG: transglutaminase-like domain-containing protein, partial [Methanobrevibacter sp.]|nr:transglutaminase-like domain-containing protein [Methanobrevibacter sp.]
MNSYSKSFVIYDWVKSKEKYHFHCDTWFSATKSLQILLKGGHGKFMNCADHSHLLNSMLRTVGIPAVYGNGDCQ